jgi:hypothetical protein
VRQPIEDRNPDARLIAESISEEGGRVTMAFEAARPKDKPRDPQLGISFEVTDSLADAFQGFILGNMMAFANQFGIAAQRVRVTVTAQLDMDGLAVPDGEGRLGKPIRFALSDRTVVHPWYALPDAFGR